jgi:GxxExxY protein
MEKQRIEYFASQIVDTSYRIHKEIGPGLLESVYLFCLMEELKIKGIQAGKVVSLPLLYN